MIMVVEEVFREWDGNEMQPSLSDRLVRRPYQAAKDADE